MISLSENFFEIFSLPQHFFVDESQLSEGYRQLQSEYHPDRYASASEAERLKAVQITSFINQAYDTLKSPVKRAGYMLVLGGENIDKVDQTQMSPDLLMEQMLLRESLEDLPEDDSALDDLTDIKKSVREKMDGCLHKFSEAIAEELPENSRPLSLYYELQFLQKMLLEIDRAEEHRLGY